ncbi:hypothetical protein Golob_011532 [Gossypium lobatum]|uniref:Uncharacterized protein n=1 Tax=Gossypium lobatum TaxID=34289 RepID=A0A7J8MPS7_9ROSI|nr:hypothetical protein [Gossypium lobatum]
MEDYHVVKFMQIQQHELGFLLSTMVIWEILYRPTYRSMCFSIY